MKKIIIGMGGGYDIVVAAMLREKLLRTHLEDEIDIGGMLNPKFIHFFDKAGVGYQEENAVNQVSKKTIKYRRNGLNTRYSYYFNNDKSIHFVDSKLSKEINGKIFDFSIYQENKEDIELFLKDNYDLIIFCDVGGDILFFGEKDKMVKTPIMDAYSIRLAHDLYEIYHKDVKVLLLGIGLDGELPYENIKDNITLIKQKKGMDLYCHIDAIDIEWLRQVYNKVRYEDKGKTNQLLIDIGMNQVDVSPLAKKREISKYKEWFHRIYNVDVEILYDLNPIAKGRTYDEMKLITAEKGVLMDRYN